MAEVYECFGLAPQDTTSLESYLKEYFGRILKKLKELDYEQSKDKTTANKKKGFFF
jgi:hypothetical protein